MHRYLTLGTVLAGLAGSNAAEAAPITPADIRAAGVAVGLSVKGLRVVNSCDESVEAPLQRDLNGDGQKELIFGDGLCEGGNAGWFGIARKTTAGKWIGILAYQGVYDLLKTRHEGWPDIQTGGPGCFGSDPRFSFRNGKYVISGSTPRRCTSGLAVPTPVNRSELSLPPSIEYLGYTGSDTYPVYNDIKVTATSGSAYMQIGIFSGDAPITGTYANGKCAVVRKKQTFRGPCDANGFSGTIYNAAGKPGQPFRFTSRTQLARMKTNGAASAAPLPMQATAYESAPPAAAGLYAVTSAGRSRLLLEPGGSCSREAALLRDYCFARPIALLQREPGRKTVTVVTMNNYWQLGTWIPLGNGQGWNVYEVKRQGDGFVAERDRQFNTKVPFPNGCNPAQVQAEGWIVGSGALGKVAIEAKKYLCDQPLPDVLTATAGDDLGVTEGPGSYASQRGPSPRPATSPSASEPYGGQWSAFGLAPVRLGYDPLAGTSVDIVGSPGTSAPAPRKRKKR